MMVICRLAFFLFSIFPAFPCCTELWQVDLRKVSQEKDKAQSEADKFSYDLERAAAQHNKAQTGLDKSQEEVARVQVSEKLSVRQKIKSHLTFAKISLIKYFP